MELTITAKEFAPGVNYQSPIKMTINRPRYEKACFFIKKAIEEVKQQSIKEQRKFLRIASKTLLTLSSISVPLKPRTIMAAAPSHTIETSMSQSLLSPEILEIFRDLILLALLLGLLIAILALMGAGLYRIFRKGEIAQSWTSDILKGLVQIILSPFVVMFIAYIIYFFIGDSEWFINPLEVFKVVYP